MSNLILYNYFRSSASFRVRIALHHKNLPFEYKPVHLVKNGGEQFSESYKKLNPLSQVPTLIDGSNTLTQSMAIISYLDEKYPQNSLFPKDPFQKAKVIEFCEIINSGIQPLQNLKVGNVLMSRFHLSEDQKNDWMKLWIGDGLNYLEDYLSKNSSQNFCFGNSLTAAECFLIPQIVTSQRFNVSIENHKIIKGIFENCMKIEAVTKALPKNQIDAE